MAVSDPAARVPEIVLRLAGISKRFGELQANDAIDLVVHRGEIVALLGENGAGKTTLMNILFGHYVADAGEIEAFGQKLPPGSPGAAIRAGIGMVHQHFTLADNLSVLENVALGTESLWRPLSRLGPARRRLSALSQRFGLTVDPDARVGDLSVGERQRVEILKALYRDARLLILDEPTAVLTPQESESLFATLRTFVAAGLSVVFISHKLKEVAAVSERVVVLRAGRVVGERPRAALDPAELAALMVGRPVPEPVKPPLAASDIVLRLTGVSADGGTAARRLESIDLDVRRNEIVAIAGVAGNGQSALADIVAGILPATAGRVEYLGRALARVGPAGVVALGVGRVPEDRHETGVVGDMCLWENAVAERLRWPEFSRWGFLNRSAAIAYTKAIIAAFDVRCPGPQTATRLLSGGNMQKMILGRALSGSPNLVLAHQPTRGLDVGAVAYVHRRLIEARSTGTAVLLISEDLDEILQLADRVAVIYHGRLSPLFDIRAISIAEIGAAMAGHALREVGHAA
jgi:simple sugar transport system ATP-binding protein